MATPIVLGQIMQIRIITRLDAQVAYNVLHYRCIGFLGVGILPSDFAAAVKTGLTGNWPPIITTPASFRGIGAQQATAPKDGEVYSVANLAGTGGANPLPKQVAGLASIYDGQAGRKHRGRIYFPFPDASAVTPDGVPIAAYKTALQVVMTFLTGPIVVTVGANQSTMALSVFHKLVGTADPVTVGVIRSVFATQRRRGDYGKANVSPI